MRKIQDISSKTHTFRYAGKKGGTRLHVDDLLTAALNILLCGLGEKRWLILSVSWTKNLNKILGNLLLNFITHIDTAGYDIAEPSNDNPDEKQIDLMSVPRMYTIQRGKEGVVAGAGCAHIVTATVS